MVRVICMVRVIIYNNVSAFEFDSMNTIYDSVWLRRLLSCIVKDYLVCFRFMQGKLKLLSIDQCDSILSY